MSKGKIQEAIEKLKDNTTGDTLILFGISFKGNELKEFANALASNTSLVDLRIRDSGIDGHTVQPIVDALKINKTLKTLDLQDNCIDGIGLRAITEVVKENATLEEIDLRMNFIRDPGAHDMAEDSIEHNHTLQQFRGISSSKIEDSLQRNRDAKEEELAIDGITQLRQEETFDNPEVWNYVLHYAIQEGNERILTLLFDGKNGVEIDSEYEEGRTSLAVVLSRKDFATADFLVRNGANPKIQDHEGCTPLHIAALHGEGDLAQSLVEHSADISLQDKDGYTPLHFAVSSQNKAIEELLLESNADIEREDKNNCKPLDSQPRKVVREVTGHRGCGSNETQEQKEPKDQRPENTISSFKEAIRLGATCIECDLYVSKDKKLMVTHDADLTWTAQAICSKEFQLENIDEGTGAGTPAAIGDRISLPEEQLYVEDLTQQELQTHFDVSSGIGKGYYSEGESNEYQVMPTFPELLDLISQENAERKEKGLPRIKLNAELKGPDTGKFITAELNEFNAQHLDRKIENEDICYLSFTPSRLLSVREEQPQAELILAVGTDKLYKEVGHDFSIINTEINTKGLPFIKEWDKRFKEEHPSNPRGLSAVDMHMWDIGDDVVKYCCGELQLPIHMSVPSGETDLKEAHINPVLQNIEKITRLQESYLDLSHAREDIKILVKTDAIEALRSVTKQESMSMEGAEILSVGGVSLLLDDPRKISEESKEDEKSSVKVPLHAKPQQWVKRAEAEKEKKSLNPGQQGLPGK